MSILKKSESLVKSRFSHFGANKIREIICLLYEISKRDQITPENILPKGNNFEFDALKKLLLRKRFPYVSRHGEPLTPYLPKMRLVSEERLKMTNRRFYPKNVFIERGSRDNYLVDAFKRSFPKSKFSEIDSLKAYIKAHKRFSIVDYNNRRDTIFIAKEKYDFFKICPCTKKAMSCGYHIFNLGFGCIYDCTYCYLQEYINSPGIILPANIDDFFNTFRNHYSEKRGLRLGTGEFSDSLMLDDIVKYSIPIINFFRKYSHIQFEFKTKSINIENLLSAEHSGNIIISWSLNPQETINQNELFTAPLFGRLIAARKCKDAGYKIGIHLDPVFYYEGWQKAYTELVEQLFTYLKPKHIAWLSIGTLRFKPKTKKIIEMRFPRNEILDGELVIGYDGKLRYPYSMRYKIYASLLSLLRKHSKKLYIYLCMEEKNMWQDLSIHFPF